MIPMREKLDPRGFRRQQHRLGLVALAGERRRGVPALDRRTRSKLLRRAGMDIGKGIVESCCYFFSANLTLGDYAVINQHVYLDNKEHISIGPRCGISMGSMLFTSNHEMGDDMKRWAEFKTAPITIGAGVWLGARAIVMPGVTIGDGCLVATGAVVAKDLRAERSLCGRAREAHRGLLGRSRPDAPRLHAPAGTAPAP